MQCKYCGQACVSAVCERCGRVMAERAKISEEMNRDVQRIRQFIAHGPARKPTRPPRQINGVAVAAICLAAVILCCLAAAWSKADEPPTLNVFCFPECRYCQIFDADANREPLRSALAKFRVVHLGKAEAPQFGVTKYPTFRVEGNPVRFKEGYIGSADLIRWLEGR